MRVIFDDRYAMPSGNGDDRFHFAANACVVYEKKTGRSSEMKEVIIVWKDNLAVKQDALKMQNKHSQQQEKTRTCRT